MKMLFSILRVASLVAATHVVPSGDWAVCMVALVWGLTCAFEE